MWTNDSRSFPLSLKSHDRYGTRRVVQSSAVILVEMNLDHVLDINEGQLVSDRAAMAEAFEKARNSGRPIVIHFHGGLVSRNSALNGAPALQAFYETKGNAYPIIPVWKTGAWEVVQNIWPQLAAEALFKILVDRVTGFVHAQMKDFVGSRSLSVERSLGRVTEEAMADSSTGDGDFTQAFLGLDVNAVRGNPGLELTEFQLASIEQELQTDTELNQAIDAVLQGANMPVDNNSRAPGIAPATQPLPTLADPDALKELQGDANTRSLSLSAATAVVIIVAKVIGRFVHKSDHGLHATVVEEVLRKFYLGAAGSTAWSKMKEYAADAFASGTADAAGTELIEELKLVPAGQRVMLVGHSAGSIFILDLLKHYIGNPGRFEIVFLAPAATVAVFKNGLVDRQKLLANSAGGHLKFRMYSMNDKFESKDTLVRNVPHLGDLTWFYPRSLLYLISGILEQDSKGKDVVDAAVAGLQRVYQPAYRIAADGEITAVRDFVEGQADRRVWSVQDHPDLRFRSNSTSHGGFGAPVAGNTSMESIAALLSSDW